MIKKLTQAQIDRLPYYVKKWTDIGLSTDKTNKEEAEKYIIESYKLAGLNPPEKIVWCGSPLSQTLVRAIILEDKNLMEKIEVSIPDSFWYSITDSVKKSVRESAGQSIRGSILSGIGDIVGENVWYSVVDSVWNEVRDSIRNSVAPSVWDIVRRIIFDSVSNNVWNSVLFRVVHSIREDVLSNVGQNVLIPSSVEQSILSSFEQTIYGYHDAYWLAFYDFFREELQLKKQTNILKGLSGLSKHCGWVLPHEKICWASERYCLLNRDERGKLHSLTSPAILYPDGWAIYAIHGIRVKEKVVLNPELITIKEIEEENNTEIKRLMIDRFGLDRFFIESGLKKLHEDKFGILYLRELPNDEPIVAVKVKNSTAESDGTFKDYFLRVPPDCKTAEEAVAWTFGFENGKYKPVIET